VSYARSARRSRTWKMSGRLNGRKARMAKSRVSPARK
jgi:hypothetical protein